MQALVPSVLVSSLSVRPLAAVDHPLAATRLPAPGRSPAWWLPFSRPLVATAMETGFEEGEAVGMLAWRELVEEDASKRAGDRALLPCWCHITEENTARRRQVCLLRF
jgi:hypothetical protein